jgi:hypothetical protein
MVTLDDLIERDPQAIAEVTRTQEAFRRQLRREEEAREREKRLRLAAQIPVIRSGICPMCSLVVEDGSEHIPPGDCCRYLRSLVEPILKKIRWLSRRGRRFTPGQPPAW